MATSRMPRTNHNESHNGHSSHSTADHAAPSARVPSNGRRLANILRRGWDLPRNLQAQVKANPAATLAGVAGASFVLGALLGSKLGRLAIAAAIPFGIQRLLNEGALKEIGRSARELIADIDSVKGPA
jgi:hypothetical protein